MRRLKSVAGLNIPAFVERFDAPAAVHYSL